jgi:DNA-binding CsgD family transcriptional regulator
MKLVSKLPYIYDVATSDDNWKTALDQFCGEGLAKGVAFYTSDNTDYGHFAEALNSFYSAKPELVTEYFTKFSNVDQSGVEVLFRSAPFKRIEDVDIWPDYLMSQSRPDLEFLIENLGTFRRAAYNISTSKGWNAIVSLNFDANVKTFSENEIRSSNLLVQHLGKALEINRLSVRLRQRYNAVLSVLDRINVGICIALKTGEIFTQNARARKIFDANDGLSLNRYGYVKLFNPDKSVQLVDCISQCCRTAQGENDSIENSLLADRRSDKEPYFVEISPLRDGGQEIENEFAGAMLLIVDPDDPPKFANNPIKVLYKLTDTETEIASMLFDGKALTQIAEIRSVALDTVKNQCRAIYAKTGANNRAQLIRKIVSISPPVE